MQALKRYYRVIALPLFEDNYSYIISGTANKCLVLVDPANPAVVMNYLTTNFPQHIVSHVLYTHKHWDHAGGSEQLSETLLKVNPDVKIVIGENDKAHVKGPNYSLLPNEELKIGHSTVRTIHVPCHTRGHTIYNFLPLNQSFLNQSDKMTEKTMEGKRVHVFASHSCTFTGDTLFIGGIGRFFQGNAAEMTQNIQNIYQTVDLDSDIFCGHEYAMANLGWGMKVQPNNNSMKELYLKLQKEEKQVGVPCSIPSSLRQEKEINVFVRAVTGSPLQESIEKNPALLMKILREMKNKNLTNFAQAQHLI